VNLERRTTLRLRDLVLWQKRQYGKGRRCVRHEHASPGFAIVAPLFMFIIERIRPPAFPLALIAPRIFMLYPPAKAKLPVKALVLMRYMGLSGKW
jgi:hypothetical protein